MGCICKVYTLWEEKKYFTPFPSIINGYNGNKDFCKKTRLKNNQIDVYIENGSFGEIFFFPKGLKKQGYICYFNIFYPEWTFTEQMANVYSPIRPTTIKGKFTVGKGKYVNKVYYSSKHQAF